MLRAARRLLIIAPLFALLLLWTWLVPEGSKAAFLIGAPTEIGRALVRVVRTNDFWADFWASVSILLVGYTAGVVLGFAAGLACWMGRRLGRVAEAYLVALGSVPLFAIAPLLIFVLGIGASTRVFIVTLSVAVPLALSTLSAARETERHYRDLLLAFTVPQHRALRLVVAPGTVFASLPALKPAANAALVAVFLSEWISAEHGLAKFVLASMSTYRVPEMWVGLLTFVVLGVAFGSSIDLIERRVTRWRPV